MDELRGNGAMDNMLERESPSESAAIRHHQQADPGPRENLAVPKLDIPRALLAQETGRRDAMRSLGAAGMAVLGALGLRDVVVDAAKKGDGKKKRGDKRKDPRRQGKNGARDRRSAADRSDEPTADSEPTDNPDEVTPAAPNDASAGPAGPGAAPRKSRKKHGGKGKRRGKNANRVQAAAVPAACCGRNSCAAPSPGNNNKSNCNYAGQTLSGNAGGANFAKIDGRGTTFAGSVQGANFFRACLQDAAFTGNVASANFDQACLVGADLSQASNLNASASLASARLCHTKLPDGTTSSRDCDRPTNCCEMPSGPTGPPAVRAARPDRAGRPAPPGRAVRPAPTRRSPAPPASRVLPAHPAHPAPREPPAPRDLAARPGPRDRRGQRGQRDRPDRRAKPARRGKRAPRERPAPPAPPVPTRR